MSLEATKERLSRKYLGRGGIHGVGLSRARNAVRVHVGPSEDTAQQADQTAVLEQLKRDAAPYKIIVTNDEAATTGGDQPD